MFGTTRDLLGYARGRTLALAAALAALIALALPALAVGATTFTVEGTGDGPKSVLGAECETAAEECTFRAAIEAANVAADRDTIKFDPSFKGKAGPTIVLGSALPVITQPLRIDATPCEPGQGPPFPCVPISAPSGSVGIDVTAGNSAVEGLMISGAQIGVRLSGAAAGNLIEGNEIQVPMGGGTSAISILNGPNEVYGNVIEGSCCLAAIVLQDNANGNRIGGDTAQSENVIDGFQNGAISMTLPESSRNEVGRDRGENGGSFIGLFKANGAEPSFPNQIDPPAIDSVVVPSPIGPPRPIGGPPGPTGPVGPSKATGTADPGATVRLFGKATEDPGEILNYLGQAAADGGGNWEATVDVSTGALVAATQTLDGGTSELSETATAHELPPADKFPPGGGGGRGESAAGSTSASSTSASSTSGGQLAPPAIVVPPAPRARISTGPVGKIGATTARFRFTSSVAGSRFQCSLDGAKFSSCHSPRIYRNLKPGGHVFRLRAISPTGLLGAVVKRAFTIF